MDQFEAEHVVNVPKVVRKCVQSRCTEEAVDGRRFCSKHVLDHVPGRPRTLSEKSERAVELAKEGMPLRVIAEALNIGKSTASRIVNAKEGVFTSETAKEVIAKSQYHRIVPAPVVPAHLEVPLKSAYETVVTDMQGKIDAVLADVAVMQERVAFLRGIMEAL